MPQDNDTRIKRLEEQVAQLQRNPGASSDINRNTGTLERKVIEDTVSDRLFSIFWDKIYWYSTGFESLDNLDVATIGAGSNASLLLGALNLATDASTSDSCSVARTVSADDSFSFLDESKFRTQVFFSDTTSQTIYITVGSALSESYGFKVTNSTLYGITARSSSVSTTTLGSINDTDLFKLEARLYPGHKVEFFVNESPKGVLTTTIPKTVSTTFFDLYISTQTTAAKDFGVYFFDYLQKRDS